MNESEALRSFTLKFLIFGTAFMASIDLYLVWNGVDPVKNFLFFLMMFFLQLLVIRRWSREGSSGRKGPPGGGGPPGPTAPV